MTSERVTVLATVAGFGRRKRRELCAGVVLLANISTSNGETEISPLEWLNYGRWAEPLEIGDVIQLNLQQSEQGFKHPSKCVRLDWHNRFRSPLLEQAIAQIESVPSKSIKFTAKNVKSEVIFSDTVGTRSQVR